MATACCARLSGGFAPSPPNSTRDLNPAPRATRRLRARAERRANDDYVLGMLLRQGYLVRVHELGGFATFREYAERLFGFTGRQVEERLRVAEALEDLPALAGRLDAGELCFSSVR